MKITVSKAVSTLKEIKNLSEHKTEDNKTIGAVIIPADKSKTGYWLGRLSNVLEPIQTSFDKTLESNQKQFSKPAIIKNEKGEEVEVAGQISFDAKSLQLYNKAMLEVNEQEEEISCIPEGGFDYEMFEGISWPASFWKEITVFLKEPK